MPDFDFTYNLSAVVTGAARVLIICLITFVLLWVLKRVVRKAITARIPKIREESPDQLALRSDTMGTVIAGAVSFVAWVVAGLMILSAVGLNVAPVLATVGVASLAVGFAAQNIIRDYFNGFFIVMEDWYRVGEVAIISGIGGLVVDITLRRTVLRDLSGTMHVIPNSKIEFASNMTRDWSRINLNVGVAYKEDLNHVIHVTNEVCQELNDDPIWGEDLLTTPKVERVDNLGDHGIDIKILGDTKPIRQWALTGELRKRLKTRFDHEGIEIPWPHTKVYFGDSLNVSRTSDGNQAS